MYDEKCLVKTGSNIRLLRTACQISQLAMAERIGVSQTHMSNLEHNNVQVSLKLLLRIANVFGCTLEDLLNAKAALAWAEAATEARETLTAVVSARGEKEKQEQAAFSLEEVQLLLKMLQLGKGQSKLAVVKEGKKNSSDYELG